MTKREYLTVALVLRIDPSMTSDLVEVLDMFPGIMIVYKRISPRQLYITDAREYAGGEEGGSH